MILIDSFFEIPETDGIQILKNIEKAGRTCYKSHNYTSDESYIPFVKMLIKAGHESVLEHEKLTVKIVCDRGVSHELVRHRIASFSQESARYCNYMKDKFNGQLTFIRPSFVHDINASDSKTHAWINSCVVAEFNYKLMIESGATAQEARSVLTNSLKTEVVITSNLREWRLILKQRTSTKAHPDMQAIMRPLLDTFKRMIPIVFDDITY